LGKGQGYPFEWGLLGPVQHNGHNGTGQLLGKNRADKVYLSSPTKTTLFENDLLAAMTHEKPSCLCGKESGVLKEAFGACLDYNEEWIGIGGSGSHKATLDQRVSTFCEGVRGTISGGGEPLVLALLLSAQDQITKMVGFIDRFYQELTQVAKFPKQPAWLLVGQCVGAVFEAMATIRAKVSPL
jgi:hypothetical protein